MWIKTIYDAPTELDSIIHPLTINILAPTELSLSDIELLN
jgi:hypothetical protein